MKYWLFGCCFLMFFIGTAQDKNEISGKVSVPAGEEAAGIAIYNLSSNKGTISDKEGKFAISASLNDTIVFSALQFQKTEVLVDQEIIQKGEMEVEIFLSTNELAEVFLTDHNLSGNLSADAKNAPVVSYNLPTMSAADLMSMDMRYPPDAQSSVSNAAMGGSLQPGGVNLLKVLSEAANFVSGFIPEKKKPVVHYNIKNVRERLFSIYDEDFFVHSLEIERERINEFLYFVEDERLSSALLEEGKELDLIEFLMEKSKIFRMADNSGSEELFLKKNNFQIRALSIAV